MIHAPAVIGEMEALTGEARAASVQATTDVDSLTMPFVELHSRVSDGDPATLKVISQVARVVARRLAAMDQKIADILREGQGKDTVRVSDLQDFQQQLADEWTV